MRWTQVAPPSGRLRRMLVRIRSTSFAVIGVLTRSTQFRGRSTGQSHSTRRSSAPPCARAHRLPQRQSCARWTRPADNALRSTYRQTARNPSSCSTGAGVPLGPGDEMPVIGENAVGTNTQRKPPVRFGHDALEGLEVRFLAEQTNAADGPVEDMIHEPAGGDACGARHLKSVTGGPPVSKLAASRMPFG